MERSEVYTLYGNVLAAQERLCKAQDEFDEVNGKFMELLSKTFPLKKED